MLQRGIYFVCVCLLQLGTAGVITMPTGRNPTLFYVGFRYSVGF